MELVRRLLAYNRACCRLSQHTPRSRKRLKHGLSAARAVLATADYFILEITACVSQGISAQQPASHLPAAGQGHGHIPVVLKE